MNPPPGYPGGPYPGMGMPPQHMGMPHMGYPPMGGMGVPPQMGGYPPMGGLPPPGYPYGMPPMGRPPYMGAPSPFPMGMPPGRPGMPPGMQPGMPPPVMPGMPPVHVAMPPGPPGPVGAPIPYTPAPGAVPVRIGAPISAPPRLIGVETTVYVGRIPASATDDFVERLLQQCGKVANWKRMMDPISNTPRPFGFARFENEEGALRALRLLSNLEIDGNQLLLNVDDKTREALDRYQKNKAAIANMKLQQQQQQQQQSASDASAPVDGKPAEEPAAEKPSEEAPAEKADEDVPDEEIVAKIKALMSDKKAGDFLKGMETSASEDGEGAESGKKDEDRQGGSSSWDKELEKERREREKERARERERRRGEREREARKRERDEREYREMEKDWETREREKERLRERRERDEKKEREWQIEKELNYDEEEDRKRRKAGKRRREREREEQDDEEDRRKEIEEEQARLEEERRRQEEELRRQQEAEADEQRASVKRSYDDAENGLTPISPDSSDQRVKLGLRISAPTLKKPTKLGVTPGFNLEEEQNPLTNPKRKKLVPLEPMRTEEQIKKEREEEAKQIVAMIPAGKADLFSFQLNWDIVDEAEIVPKKMKPWVTKKIVEYLGEEEATLIEFVLAKMSNHMSPQEILDQLAFVLEDEAEVFVIKLWRMLIFEMIRAEKAKERGVNIAA